MAGQKTITFLTNHYYHSRRRAGFHNLADAAYRAGYKVNFVTVGYSLFSYLRRDYRTKIRGIGKNLNRGMEVFPDFISYVHFTSWHPITFFVPFLNKLSSPLMDKYSTWGMEPVLKLAEGTDVFVFESSPGLFLFNTLKKANPSAKMIYRVSDDLRVLRSVHPRLIEWQADLVPCFDCISVPTKIMKNIFPGDVPVRVDKHGLDKELFDRCQTSPYPAESKNAVIIGTFRLDADFFKIAAEAYPDVTFHLIGPLSRTLSARNVVFYGELPFRKTIGYVKFADVGLLALKYKNEASKTFSDCLKVIQYRYCGLPIVSPEFIDLDRQGVYYYQPGDSRSIITALGQAISAGRNPEFALEARSWDEVFQDMLGGL